MFKISKILIADDHPLFRDALQQAIGKHFTDIEIVCAESFSSLQQTLRHHDDTDLILLDLHMPGAVGFSTLHYLGISHEHIPVAIISANEETEIIVRAMKHGATGFIPKSSSIDTIIAAIEAIMEGNVWFPSNIDSERDTFENNDFMDYLSTLTPKQFRVLMMLVEGRTNVEIAEQTHVTIATVKAHLSEIFKKLNVSNRTQAAMMAAMHLEVDNPDSRSFN